MTDLILVFTTVGARYEAEQLAASLVEQSLASCVQISGPIHSIYRWQGRQESSEEWSIAIKTLKSCFAALEAAIRAQHPYEQPEIVAVDISHASAGYAAWVKENCQSDAS
jgi:periplasmic divalent cation tolerance protein